MRVLDHHCARVTPAMALGREWDIVCSCGETFSGPIEDGVNALTAHVVAHIAASALDRERPARSAPTTKRGRLRVWKYWY